MCEKNEVLFPREGVLCPLPNPVHRKKAESSLLCFAKKAVEALRKSSILREGQCRTYDQVCNHERQQSGYPV